MPPSKMSLLAQAQHCRKVESVTRLSTLEASEGENGRYRRSCHSIALHAATLSHEGEGSISRSTHGYRASLSLIPTPTCVRMEARFRSVIPELLQLGRNSKVGIS